MRTAIAAIVAVAVVVPASADSLPTGFTGEIEIGVIARRLHTSMDSAQLAHDAPNYVATPTAARTIAAAPQSIDAAGMRIRVAFGDADGFYFGSDGDALADVVGPSITASVDGAPITAAPSATLLMHAFAGWRHQAARGIGFAELAAGGGITGFGTRCVDAACGMRYRDVGELVGDVEVRAGFEAFVTPVVVVGASLGASLIERGEVSGGVMIGVICDRAHARGNRPH